MDSSGLVWIQGSNGGANEAMIRLTSTGELDASFVNGGQNVLNRGAESWTSIAGFQLDSNDNAIIYGTDNSDFAFTRMDSVGVQGSFDTPTYFDFGEGQHAFDVELDMYSGPVLAGDAYSSTDFDDDMAFAVFDNSGSGSTSFGTYGQYLQQNY